MWVASFSRNHTLKVFVCKSVTPVPVASLEEMQTPAADCCLFDGLCQPGRLHDSMHQTSNGACSLASVKSKGAKKKRKRDQDDSDEADEFSESDSELGEPLFVCLFVYKCCYSHRASGNIKAASLKAASLKWKAASLIAVASSQPFACFCRVQSFSQIYLSLLCQCVALMVCCTCIHQFFVWLVISLYSSHDMAVGISD